MSTEAAAAIFFGVLQVSISVVALWQQHRLYQDRQGQRTFSTTHHPDAELISGQGYGSKGRCIWIEEGAATLLLLLMMFLDQRALDLGIEATKT
jgi:ABC-type Fe3+ transport system permease subunit